MRMILLASALLATTATAAHAQQAAEVSATSDATAVVAAPVVARPANVSASALPANSEITLAFNEELTTKGIKQGHRFTMRVAEDVTIGDHIVIPRGTPAHGEVTWRTGKGAFGKSAKMEIELRYVDLNGRRIPVTGKYRREGGGNTGAAVGAAVAVGVFGAFVTGRSATFAQDEELTVRTTEDLPITLAAN